MISLPISTITNRYTLSVLSTDFLTNNDPISMVLLRDTIEELVGMNETLATQLRVFGETITDHPDVVSTGSGKGVRRKRATVLISGASLIMSGVALYKVNKLEGVVESLKDGMKELVKAQEAQLEINDMIQKRQQAMYDEFSDKFAQAFSFLGLIDVRTRVMIASMMAERGPLKLLRDCQRTPLWCRTELTNLGPGSPFYSRAMLVQTDNGSSITYVHDIPSVVTKRISVYNINASGMSYSVVITAPVYDGALHHKLVPSALPTFADGRICGSYLMSIREAGQGPRAGVSSNTIGYIDGRELIRHNIGSYFPADWREVLKYSSEATSQILEETTFCSDSTIDEDDPCTNFHGALLCSCQHCTCESINGGNAPNGLVWALDPSSRHIRVTKSNGIVIIEPAESSAYTSDRITLENSGIHLSLQGLPYDNELAEATQKAKEAVAKAKEHILIAGTKSSSWKGSIIIALIVIIIVIVLALAAYFYCRRRDKIRSAQYGGISGIHIPQGIGALASLHPGANIAMGLLGR